MPIGGSCNIAATDNVAKVWSNCTFKPWNPNLYHQNTVYGQSSDSIPIEIVNLVSLKMLMLRLTVTMVWLSFLNSVKSLLY